jgi:thiol-disulfide isomerase/thioredoxin
MSVLGVRRFVGAWAPCGGAGVLAVALAVTVSACSNGTDPASSGAVEVDGGGPQVVQLLRDPAPMADFSVTDLSGRTHTLQSLKGKVVLVNFWATWCPPCRAEIPDLIKLQKKYRDQLVVLGISQDEGPVETVQKFAVQQDINYPIAMSTPELEKVFRGIAALPTTFVIDREGRLAQRHVGMLNAQRTELEAQVLAGLNTTAKVEYVADERTARLENAAQAKSIPGVDLSKLTPEKRTEAIKALNAEDCTCGCTLTLAACRINDPECPTSLPLAQKVAQRIAGP